MNSEFIPYEQALELKNLGFDEPCLGYYHNKELSFGPRVSYGEVIEVPTFSQAFRWFREKYGLIGYIQTSYITHEVINNKNIPCTPRIEFTFGIINTIGKSIFSSFKQNNLKIYEEAEFECLKKLIEICRKLK